MESLKSYGNKILNDDQRIELSSNQSQEQVKLSSRALQPLRSDKLGKGNRYSSDESMLEGKQINFIILEFHSYNPNEYVK